MLLTALNMLLNDRAKCLGMVIGLSFSTFIIVQQSAIFAGLMIRTYGFITDTSQPDIWVMNDQVRFVDDVKPLRSTRLLAVRGVEGVEWAVPCYKGRITARLRTGRFQQCVVIGIDAASMIGAPPFVEGRIEDLRREDAIIVNKADTTGTFPVALGSILEINDKRAVVVGFCRTTPTFQSQPVVYTTYRRALNYAPKERKQLSFILVKGQQGVSLQKIKERIVARTGLKALTKKEFQWLTVRYYMKETGIPINFGIAVLLGFVIGVAIAGQMFYGLILENLPFFALFKVMGAGRRMLNLMARVQALWVGVVGWGIGIGAAALFGFFTRHTELSFVLLPEIYALSLPVVVTICIASATGALRRVHKVDPVIVFRGGT
ncbi:MAG: ABC transporter permease [Simkaniaceae bacterium]|nr:ABC transporter permease [Simkaniaceae bacterium]